MNSSERVISKRLLEVWEWKDALRREVEGLPVREGLRKMIEKGRECARRSGLPTANPLPKVAETRAKYGR